MTFKHLTRWNPQELSTSKEYSTDWATSNYWSGKLRTDWVEQTIKDLPIALMDTIVLGNQKLGTDIVQPLARHGKCASELFKEYVFEEVRLGRFNRRPSRKKCMFLFGASLDHERMAREFGFSLETYNVIEIEVLETFADLVSVQYPLLNCSGKDHQEITDFATRYWAGTDEVGFTAETLFLGRFRVIRTVWSAKG